jgi:hypothetical protein
MGSKQKTRRRPSVQTVQENIRRDEHQMCATQGCRNVIAVWTRESFCSWCRSHRRRRRRNAQR